MLGVSIALLKQSFSPGKFPTHPALCKSGYHCISKHCVTTRTWAGREIKGYVFNLIRLGRLSQYWTKGLVGQISTTPILSHIFSPLLPKRKGEKLEPRAIFAMVCKPESISSWRMSFWPFYKLYNSVIRRGLDGLCLVINKETSQSPGVKNQASASRGCTSDYLFAKCVILTYFKSGVSVVKNMTLQSSYIFVRTYREITIAVFWGNLCKQ